MSFDFSFNRVFLIRKRFKFSCNDFNKIWKRRVSVIYNFRIFNTKKNNRLSIFFIIFRRVVDKIIEINKSFNSFWINNFNFNIISQKKRSKIYMINNCGFNNYNNIIKFINNSNKFIQILSNKIKFAFFKFIQVVINNAKIKRLYRDINTTNHISLLKVTYGILNVFILKLPIYTSFKAQPTHWKYRDRGTDFITSFKPIKNVFLVPYLKFYNTFL